MMIAFPWPRNMDDAASYSNMADVASSYNNLANVMQSQGKHAEALDLYRKSLDLKLKLHGREHKSVANSYNNMGNLCQAQGKYEVNPNPSALTPQP